MPGRLIARSVHRLLESGLLCSSQYCHRSLRSSHTRASHSQLCTLINETMTPSCFVLYRGHSLASDRVASSDDGFKLLCLTIMPNRTVVRAVNLDVIRGYVVEENYSSLSSLALEHSGKWFVMTCRVSNWTSPCKIKVHTTTVVALEALHGRAQASTLKMTAVDFPCLSQNCAKVASVGDQKRASLLPIQRAI